MVPSANNGRSIIVLVGPTASGKTSIALEIAGLLSAEIISADSRQVYKLLDVGTAKPSLGQQKGIPHHFVDALSPDEDFSAGTFGILGRKLIDEVFARGKVPLVVGGSGLYVRSLIDGFADAPEGDSAFRSEMESRLQSEGVGPLIDALREVDPMMAENIDITKPRRIIRALEVYRLTGAPLSELQKGSVEISFDAKMFGLHWDRSELYKRIEHRCDCMIAEGLLEEAEGLRKRGLTPATNALNTVGYAEAFRFLNGEVSHEEFVRLFKQNSRRYAKRQLTWFRADKRIRWIEMSESRQPMDVAKEIVQLLKQTMH
ncbi:MAG TPA: tRNA (adenosine(37)-N6)-dimethylallyltransferase MiaA [Bacteroidota bacterium]